MAHDTDPGLLSILDNTPVKTLRQPRHTPETLLPALFGPQTVVLRTVECGHLAGAWLGPWVAILPGPSGLTGIAIADLADGEGAYWDKASWGERADRVTVAIERPFIAPAPDMMAFAAACVQATNPDPELAWSARTAASTYPSGDFRGMSRYLHGWLLRAALARLAADGAPQESVMTMLALLCEPARLDAARGLVEVLGNIEANWEHVDEAEAVFIAVAAEHGVTLRPVDVERRVIQESLLAVPREVWRAEAWRLLNLHEPLLTDAEAAAARAAAEAKAAQEKAARAQAAAQQSQATMHTQGSWLSSDGWTPITFA